MSLFNKNIVENNGSCDGMPNNLKKSYRYIRCCRKCGNSHGNPIPLYKSLAIWAKGQRILKRNLKGRNQNKTNLRKN